MQPPQHQRQEVQFAHAALQERDQDQTAITPQQADIPGQVRAADHVQHHIHALAGGELARPQHEVLGAIVDGLRGPEFAAEARLLIAAHGDDRRRTDMACQLDRGQADAAGAAVHQHALAAREPSHPDQVCPDRKPVFRQAGGLRQAQWPRDRQCVARRGDAELRITAAGHQRAHGIACLPLRDAAADRRHAACDLESQDRRGARRRRVATHALHDVRPIHTGVMNFDQDLTLGCYRRRCFGDAQALRGARRAVIDEIHGPIISRAAPI